MAGAGDNQGKPGNRSAADIRRVGRDELDEVLAQALRQECADLVLLGPGAWNDKRASTEKAPGRLVLQVRARSIPMLDFRAFAQLRSLTITDLAIDDRWAAEIASNLKQLTSLDLGQNSIGDAGATAIAANLRQLTSLDLAGNSIGEAGATAIASNLKQLTSLDLGRNSIGEAGATAIASNLKQLTSLDLGWNSIGDAGATAIASNLEQLTSLALWNNLGSLAFGGGSIGDAGATAIASNLNQLTSLHLGGDSIGDAGATAIASNLNQLTSLHLDGTSIGDVGATAIASNLKQLTSLHLGGNSIGDAGATAIASNLKQLTSLDLQYDRIGDAGTTAIASNLNQLTSLDLAGNRIGDAGATAIAMRIASRFALASLAVFVAPFPSSADVGTTGTNYFLQLEGAPCGFVKAVSGGSSYADVIPEPAGPSYFVKKHIGPPRYVELSTEIGFGMAKEVYAWIGQAWNMSPQLHSGSIITLDRNLQPISERRFSSARLTEVTIPACDGSRKDPGYMTVKLMPEFVQNAPPSPGPTKMADQFLKNEQKVWLSSGFELKIDGIDCKKVSRIDAFTVKMKGPSDSLDVDRGKALQAARLDFPNLRIRLPQAHAYAWIAWYDDFVVKGNNADTKERNGQLSFLPPNGGPPLLVIKLYNVGIYRLDSEGGAASSDAIKHLVVELYVERMELVYGKNVID